MPNTELSATWPVELDPCACDCGDDVPVISIYTKFLSVPDTEGIGYSDWELFDPGFTQAGPSAGPDDVLIRAQFRYTGGDGRLWKMRLRVVKLLYNGEGLEQFDSIGATFTLYDALASGVLKTDAGIDYVQIPNTADGLNYLVGPPGKVGFIVEGHRQEVTLRKRGFPVYSGTQGSLATIYRQETVTSGGYPGGEPLGAGTTPARTYSGFQRFSDLATGSPPLTDPAGEYASTLSADLLRMGYASAPLSDVRQAETFGTVVDDVTTRTMTRSYRDTAGAPHTESLHLSLSQEYTLAVMQAEVDDNLADQLAAAGAPGPIYDGPAMSGVALVFGGLVARNSISSGQTRLSKLQSQITVRCLGAPVYLDPGFSLTANVRWVRRRIDRANGAITDTNFSLPCSVAVPAEESGGAFASGRNGVSTSEVVLTNAATTNTEIWLREFETDENPAIGSDFYLEPMILADIPP